MAGSNKSAQSLLPGTLELLVLRVIEDEPLHGYAVMKRIRETSGEAIVVEEGSLYPALHRMVRHGWLKTTEGRSESNRRAIFYKLSPEGRRVLKQKRADWTTFAEAMRLVIGDGRAQA